MSDPIGGGNIHILRYLTETLARTDLGTMDKLQAVYKMSLAHRMSAVGYAIAPLLEEVVASGPLLGCLMRLLLPKAASFRNWLDVMKLNCMTTFALWRHLITKPF